MRSSRVLVLLVLLSLGVRAFRLGAHGPWQDEWTVLLNSAGLTGASYNDALLPPSAQDLALRGGGSLSPSDFWAFATLPDLTAASIRDDSGNGWIHKVLLQRWVEVAGVGDVPARLPSVLFGVAAVPLTFLVARALAIRRGTALVAAALVAVHPLLVRSSQEIRGYTLATAFSLVSSCVLIMAVRRGPASPAWPWAAYVAAIAISFLSHYLALSLVAGHALYLAAARPPRRVWIAAAVSAATLAALLAAWYALMGKDAIGVAWLLSQDFKRRAALAIGGAYALPATPRHLLAGLTQLALAQCGNQLQELGLRLRFLTVLLAVPAGLVVLALRELRRTGQSLAAWFLLAASLAYATLALAASVLQGHTILFTTRYAQFGAPYLAILLGVGLVSAARGPSRRAAPGALVVAHAAVVVVSLWPAYAARIGGVAGPPRRPNAFAAAARTLEAAYRPADVLAVQDLLDAKKLNLYLRGQPIRERLDAALPAHGVVLRGPRGTRPLLVED